tara:strand:+ start:1263 stop:4139 length:2877 start_codon:yes stop_codon:yes gene_type:complete
MVKILKEALGSLAKAVDSAEQRSFGARVPDDEVTKMQSGDVVIKAMPEDDLKALNKYLADQGYKKGLNLGRIGEIFGSPTGLAKATGDRLKLEDFDVETVLKNIKENNKELFEQMRRETKSMDALMAMAEETGIDTIIHRFLGRKPGSVAPPEHVLGGVAAIIKLGRELQYGAKQALDMTDQAAKEDAFKRLRIIATVQSNLAAQVAGNVSEYGRGLAVVSNISKLEGMNLSSYASQLDEFVAGMDDGLIDYHLNTFLTLQNPSAKAKYAEAGWGAKTYDFAMEQYINALLSSPVTHMVNMAGNASFQLLALAERGLAGVIGQARTLGGRRGDVGDLRYMGEMAAEAHGLAMAQKDAFLLMAKTMGTGETSDLVSKIDLRNRRALGGTDNLADVGAAINQGDYFKAFVDVMGISSRIPGRMLASEDEYFKVITMRKVLYREAYRGMQAAFQQARRSNLSRDEAKALAEDAYVKIMTDTPQDIKDMMTVEARKMTFQGAPEGFFGRMGPAINTIPFIKTVVPFYNTPTNIINEVFDRTLNWSPLYKAIKGNISGKELDDALAKLAIGNGTAAGMFALANGDYGDNIIVTGRLGKDFATRQNISSSANIPPYSIGFKQEDGSYRFRSFSRFDPFSAMLAMGADMAEYVRYEDDPSAIATMAKAYTLSIAEYATNLPFLQGVAELQKAIGGSTQSQEDLFERMAKWAGATAGGVATNVAGNIDRSTFGFASYASNYLTDGKYPLVGTNSFQATLERIDDPYASSTKLPPGVEPISGNLYTEAPLFMQGFYTAMQKAKARNPHFTEGLPDKLDFWGRSKTQGEGRKDEYFNPIRIQTGQYNELDQELLRLSETGIGAFPFHRDRVDGIKLNSEQFNEYVKLINGVDSSGRLLGELGFKPEETLLNALQNQLKDPDSGYFTLPTDEDRFKELNGILSNAKSKARKRLIESDPSLDARIIMQTP